MYIYIHVTYIHCLLGQEYYTSLVTFENETHHIVENKGMKYNLRYKHTKSNWLRNFMVAGSIPGPILFGKVIDVTCVLWQDRCGGEGACYFYNNMQMSYNLLAIGLVFIVLSVIFFALALVFYNAKPAVEEDNMLTVTANGSSIHSSLTTLTMVSTPASTPTTEVPFSSIGDQSFDNGDPGIDTEGQNCKKN